MYNTKKQLITVESRHCKGKNENRLKAFVNNKYSHVKGLNFNTAVTKRGYKTVLFSMVSCPGNVYSSICCRAQPSLGLISQSTLYSQS